MLPPRNCLLHDLNFRVFLQSLQYCIVFWALLTHLFMPILNTALSLQTLGTLVIV